MTGTFIVLEGPDGSGTTKHSQFLAENLRKRGFDVLLTAEPTEGPIGKMIRSILEGDTLPTPEAIQLLFCADRADHVRTVVEPALQAGKIVISDRYALSTIIYGAAFGLSSEWLTSVNDPFPKPDLTLVTLPPFDVCTDRLGRRESQDQFEANTFQRQVYNLYKAYEDPKTLFIDTSDEKHIVAKHIEQLVLDELSLSPERLKQ